jgi:hypothetical protein
LDDEIQTLWVHHFGLKTKPTPMGNCEHAITAIAVWDLFMTLQRFRCTGLESQWGSWRIIHISKWVKPVFRMMVVGAIMALLTNPWNVGPALFLATHSNYQLVKAKGTP